jgi:hypothetical protein
MDKTKNKIRHPKGVIKNPSKHLCQKLRNKTLRNLVFLIKKVTSLPYGHNNTELEKHITELDNWIMTTLDCSQRTAWEYRQAIMALLCDWN